MKSITAIDRIGVIGTSGAGKSNTTYVLLEQIRKKKQPIIILDHKGEYLDLPGCEIVKAKMEAPKALPVRLRNSNMSVVIDLRGCPDVYNWVGSFFKTCLNLPRKAPVLIVVEEAHNYIPQRGKITQSKVWGNNLASEGRSKGYGLMLISQRCSKLDKDSLCNCEYLYIHRHHFKSDLDYLEEIVGKERIAQVQTLKTGEILHLDMRSYKFSTFQMPLAKHKSSGGTPTPKSVKPDKEKFYGWEPGRPEGSGAQVPQQMAPEYAEGPASETSDLWIYAIIIIFILVICGVFGYYVMRGQDKKIEETKTRPGQYIDPKEGTPF